VVPNMILSAVLLVAVVAAATEAQLFNKELINEVNRLKTTWQAGHNHYFDDICQCTLSIA